MKIKALKTIFWLTAAVTLTYTLFLGYGITLVGFRVLAPWVNLECGLLALSFACFASVKSRECNDSPDDFKRSATPSGWA